MTVDRGIVLVDETTSELGLYVGMTRGRHANHALVATDAGQPEHQGWRELPTAREVLARVLARDSAERSATEMWRDRLSPESPAQPEQVTGKVDRSAGRASDDQSRWLGDDEQVRELCDLIDLRLDEQFGPKDDRYAWPEAPSWGRAEPGMPSTEIDVGPDLW